MANVFLLPPALCEEDRFTASLHAVIECVPALGQVFADWLLTSAGRPPAAFLRTENHPKGTAEDRPDFLVECEGLNILCEHKLSAPLGPRQLQRYLNLDWGNPTDLALISNRPTFVPPEVVAHPRYLRPQRGPTTHFSWPDFYPLVAARPERLAQDFAGYMRSLGMKPPELPASWDGLFTDPTTARHFGEQWRLVKTAFVAQGANCTTDADQRGFQIKRLLPWLSLLYLHIDPPAEASDPRVGDAFLGARIYTPAGVIQENVVSGAAEEVIAVGERAVRSCPRNRPASWGRGHRLVREYYTELAPVLALDGEALRGALLEFALGVLAHARGLADGNGPDAGHLVNYPGPIAADKLGRYREIIRRTVEEYASWSRGTEPGIVDEVVFDPVRDHYELRTIGWRDSKRVDFSVVHLDIIDGKVWLQRDGTNRPVAEALVEAGIPKEDIVLAEQPPEVRPHTGYAIG